mmetsp:Transcript_76745/g.237067  ORF Transcript_76745/g.237067 Transcript_76745/m.237067 type:complete len:204 (+) Transcript_76745:593-1204(+)
MAVVRVVGVAVATWLLVVLPPEERGHREAHKQHENHGDARLDPLLRFRVRLCAVGRLLHVLLGALLLAVGDARDAAQREGRQQDLHLDGLHRDVLVCDVVHKLAHRRDRHGVHRRPSPGAGDGDCVELPEGDAQHEEDEPHLDRELPLEAGYADLQRHEEEQRAQVVEDGQDSGLAEDPGLLQAGCLQHAEEDAGAGRSRKEA